LGRGGIGKAVSVDVGASFFGGGAFYNDLYRTPSVMPRIEKT
jgi:hypothetical protein